MVAIPYLSKSKFTKQEGEHMEVNTWFWFTRGVCKHLPRISPTTRPIHEVITMFCPRISHSRHFSR